MRPRNLKSPRVFVPWPADLRPAAMALLLAGALPGLSFAQSTEKGAPGHPAPERSAEAFAKAGDMAMSGGDLNSAIAFYQKATALAPKDPSYKIKLGQALGRSGDAPAAYDVLQQAHALDRKSPEIDLALGRVALRLDRGQEALTYLQDAQQKQADDPQVWNALGVAHDALGQHAEAQNDYQKGLALKPGDMALRNNLGLSQALAGNYPAAIATLTDVAADPAATAGNRLNLSLVYGLAGDDQKAAEAARRDLGEADNAANRQYYRLLKAMDDRTRTRAIFGLGSPVQTVSTAPR
ncbi:MAG TPA: tetratricopeptide repeat protein [Caulobacteraceae bacterium]